MPSVSTQTNTPLDTWALFLSCKILSPQGHCYCSGWLEKRAVSPSCMSPVLHKYLGSLLLRIKTCWLILTVKTEPSRHGTARISTQCHYTKNQNFLFNILQAWKGMSLICFCLAWDQTGMCMKTARSCWNIILSLAWCSVWQLVTTTQGKMFWSLNVRKSLTVPRGLFCFVPRAFPVAYP